MTVTYGDYTPIKGKGNSHSESYILHHRKLQHDHLVQIYTKFIPVDRHIA